MRIRWRGFELPSSVSCDEASATDSYAEFTVEPFERGFGVTIGNSLRRVLLSSLEGAAVTSINIEGAPHEFSALEGVYEDVADIVLNVKQLRIRMLHDRPVTLRIDVKRKGAVTGADIIADGDVEVVSKDLTLCTLTDAVHFVCEMTATKGRGYRTAEENEVEDTDLGVIPVDSIFSPVVRVKYHVEDARVGQSINYDRLVMDIWTDGTVEPGMALVEAAKILRKHLSPFVNVAEPGRELPEAEAPRLPDIQEAAEAASADEDMPLSDLDLSVRASHCLESESIRTVGALAQMTEAQLLQLRNFGMTSLEEVKGKLAEVGMSLAPDEEEPDDEEPDDEEPDDEEPDQDEPDEDEE